MRTISFLLAIGAVVVPNQAPGQAGGAAPALERLPEWGRIRTAAAPVLGWRVGIAASNFRQLTLSEAAAKAGEMGLSAIAGFSAQKISAEIPKNLDYNLAPGEVMAVKDRLRGLNVRMPVYHIASINPDEPALRKLFEFAKSLGIETIVCAPGASSLTIIDKLANEYGVRAALDGYRDPKNLLEAMEARSKRIGAHLDFGSWSQAGIQPRDLLALLKERVFAVSVPGTGQSGLPEFLRDMYRLELKPSLITVDTTSAADLSIQGFEKALQPVMADRVNQISRTTAIRGPDRVAPKDRERIEAALPQQAAAKPKKPRKLLVMDLNIAYGGHRSIPHANLALELMGKRTGAYEAIFSNDLENLKFEKIRQFDAVYLNNMVGMIFVDPDVRDGLTRFIREGGGLAGHHGTTHASMDWAEFSEMIGARGGSHRDPTERATLKVDDPASPLTAAFEGRELVQEDEFYRFPTGPYSRETLHVLLSIDVDKTDMNQGRACARCFRPDHDYAVSWIRSYGKGRVFYCTLGHDPTFFMTPHMAQHFLAGIQFVLGDLDADTTPSAKLVTRTEK